jgi:hypothetical protein
VAAELSFVWAGPKLFNPDRVVFALQNLMPGDILDRNKIIIKPRRTTDSHKDSISPIVFDMLVDGWCLPLLQNEARFCSQCCHCKGSLETVCPLSPSWWLKRVGAR